MVETFCREVRPSLLRFQEHSAEELERFNFATESARTQIPLNNTRNFALSQCVCLSVVLQWLGLVGEKLLNYVK